MQKAISSFTCVLRKTALTFLFVLMLDLLSPPVAQAATQCAPYARQISGIDLHGMAKGWWKQAGGVYDRGHTPKVGSVLVFKATHAMPAGHVAVVSAVLDARHILIDHANWSRPGMIEHSVLAEDVSSSGDWSQVRVWYAPTHSLGLRATPAFGFIYDQPPYAASPETPTLSGMDTSALTHGS